MRFLSSTLSAHSCSGIKTLVLKLWYRSHDHGQDHELLLVSTQHFVDLISYNDASQSHVFELFSVVSNETE